MALTADPEITNAVQCTDQEDCSSKKTCNNNTWKGKPRNKKVSSLCDAFHIHGNIWRRQWEADFYLFIYHLMNTVDRREQRQLQ